MAKASGSQAKWHHIMAVAISMKYGAVIRNWHHGGIRKWHRARWRRRNSINSGGRQVSKGSANGVISIRQRGESENGASGKAVGRENGSNEMAKIMNGGGKPSALA